MRDPRTALTILWAYATAIGSVALILWTPAIVGFGVAFLGAASWCMLLDHWQP